ncbi:hypothetical protein BDM02DRAFT_3193776 [Thelephora ganbajun]|uniref:Uncharacterized protein n=1 Tax=Thelephora ganbajun TaxID=370292 RepID=A0ACB6YY23_THEGA|nr:hypothetical protein BDM02DRAFT_3193776 [Thelephora ganbajun]
MRLKEMGGDLADHKECIDDHAGMINSLSDRVCRCNDKSLSLGSMGDITPVVLSGDSSSSSLLYLTPPKENSTPIPIPLWQVPPGLLGPGVPAPSPIVQEMVTELIPISEEREREIEDTLVGAWQAQGWQSLGMTQGTGQVASLEVRAYHLLSVMRVVTLMPNSNVHARLVSCGLAGEMQIVFLLDTVDFDALSSEQIDYDVHGLYDVVLHGTICIDDATDELGNDILETVEEEREGDDQDWTDEE